MDIVFDFIKNHIGLICFGIVGFGIIYNVYFKKVNN